MEHRDVVQREFSRQAESFAAAPVLAAPEITRRVGDALRGLAMRRVLDLACGPGLLLATLAAEAGSVVGLDLTGGTLRVAARGAAPACGAQLVQAQAERSPFPDGTFDAVVVRLALHHMDRPASVLAEAHRLLRVGGRLVVLDVLTSADPEKAALHNAIERLRDPSHVAFVPEAELRRRISDAGFSLISGAVWPLARRFSEWAAVVSDPARMGALELVLRQLSRAGVDAGIGLREEGEELCFTYSWALLAAEAA